MTTHTDNVTADQTVGADPDKPPRGTDRQGKVPPWVFRPDFDPTATPEEIRTLDLRDAHAEFIKILHTSIWFIMQGDSSRGQLTYHQWLRARHQFATAEFHYQARLRGEYPQVYRHLMNLTDPPTVDTLRVRANWEAANDAAADVVNNIIDEAYNEARNGR